MSDDQQAPQPPSAVISPPPPPLAGPPPPPPSFVPPPPGQVHGHTGFGINAKGVRSSFRRLNWEKLPHRQIDGDNIWNQGDSTDGNLILNTDDIDDLFKLPENRHKNKNKSPSPLSWKTRGAEDTHDNDGPITLLDPKKSLNTNIFLKQFKKSNDAIVKSIEICENSIMNGEQLQTLLRLLPEDGKETKVFTEFKGDKGKLDNAEQFILKVLEIPHYKTRIEATLLRDSFEPNTKYIEASFATLEQAMREIRTCRALPKIMNLVLQAGNYLNQGASLGNASGFRLASLKALSDTKANKPGITLMHYVSMTLESQNKEMMNWPGQLSSLSEACKISEKELADDLESYSKKIKLLKSKMKAHSIELLQSFIEMSESFIELLKEKEKSFMRSKKDFAKYICENPNKFKLQESFAIVEEFRKTFVKASSENKEREKRKNRKNASKISSKSEIMSPRHTSRHTTTDRASWKKSVDDSSVPSRHTVSATVDPPRGTLDINKMQHVTLTKLEPIEVRENKEKSSRIPAQDGSRLTVKNTREQVEGTSPPISPTTTIDGAVASSIARRRRRRSDRSISLVDGAWSESSFRSTTRERLSPRITMQSADDFALELRQKQQEDKQEKEIKVEEVEDAFISSERENAFARTRMRRSYMRLDRAGTVDESSAAKPVEVPLYRRSQSEITNLEIPSITVTDEDQKPKANACEENKATTRLSRVSTIVTERNEESKRKLNEIRERIRQYKESTNKLEEDALQIERNRSSSKESNSFTAIDHKETQENPINDRLSARRIRRSAKLAELSQFYKETDTSTVLYATTDSSNNTSVHMVQAETDIFSDLASKELENLNTETVTDTAEKKMGQPETNTVNKSTEKPAVVRVSPKPQKTVVNKSSPPKPKSQIKSQSMVNVSRARTSSKLSQSASKTLRKQESPSTPKPKTNTTKSNSLLSSKRLSSSALNLSSTPTTIRVNKTTTNSVKTKNTMKRDDTNPTKDDSRERSVSDPISPEDVKKANVNSSWVSPPVKTLSKQTKKPTTVHKTINVVQHTKLTETRTKKSAPSSYKFQSLPRTSKTTTTSNTLPKSSSKTKLHSKLSNGDVSHKAVGIKPSEPPQAKTTPKAIVAKTPAKNSNLRSVSSTNISRIHTPKERHDVKATTRKNLSSRSSTDVTKTTSPQSTGVMMNRAARLRLLMKTPTPDKQKVKTTK